MKNPSMMKMAEQLMYKEAILSLPNNLHKDDGIALANKIEKYILDAFDSANWVLISGYLCRKYNNLMLK